MASGSPAQACALSVRSGEIDALQRATATSPFPYLLRFTAAAVVRLSNQHLEPFTVGDGDAAVICVGSLGGALGADGATGA